MFFPLSVKKSSLTFFQPCSRWPLCVTGTRNSVDLIKQAAAMDGTRLLFVVALICAWHLKGKEKQKCIQRGEGPEGQDPPGLLPFGRPLNFIKCGKNVFAHVRKCTVFSTQPSYLSELLYLPLNIK